jgi:hypothetical protein
MLLTSFILQNWLWFLIGIVFIVGILFLGLLLEKPQKAGYAYRRRNCVMTKSEHALFDLLNQTVGNKYYVFPQVHLPTILDHMVKGQSWIGAFRHINQKSVDFVLCDKINSSPILAIELDDRSHERPDRIERDHEVERIFTGADMPLLRLKGILSPTELTQKIESSINPPQVPTK